VKSIRRTDEPRTKKSTRNDTIARPVSKIAKFSQQVKPGTGETAAKKQRSVVSACRKLSNGRISIYSDPPTTITTKIQALETKIKNFGRTSQDDHNIITDSELPPKTKIHQLSNLLEFNNESAEDQLEIPNAGNAKISHNFKFDLDPSITDPESLLYQIQMPLIKLKDMYNINQFRISSSLGKPLDPQLKTGPFEINDEATSSEKAPTTSNNSFEISSIQPFNDLIKLVTLIPMIPGTAELGKREVMLVNYKQRREDFKRFQRLSVGDLIELNGHLVTDTGDSSIEMYYDWQIVE
jgi:hypothetical protein